MASRLGTVVPPARVPQALKQGGRMTCNEVDVPTDRLLDQLQPAAPITLRVQLFRYRREVARQLEHHACFRLRLKEEQVEQQPIRFLPSPRFQEIPRSEP